jgi:hypothetical protein
MARKADVPKYTFFSGTGSAPVGDPLLLKLLFCFARLKKKSRPNQK